jgi:predicted nucleotidyltransferase component of viral defense system
MNMISKERLVKEQQATGYRQEIIEKVVWLINVLNSIAEDSYLKNRLALKGGTALNLFYFELPRLSVDADFNYIGAVDKETMLKERPELEQRLQKLLQRLGLSLARNSQVHAGGKMSWRYPSALGNQGTIEIDINFMYRAPLLPSIPKTSIKLAGQQINDLLLLDLHEVAAGKLAALIDRGAGRDIFDAFHLFQHPGINKMLLRQLFVVYAAMSHKKNFLDIEVKDVIVDRKDLQNKLIPVLSHHSHNFRSAQEWVDHLTQEVQLHFKQLLPFTEKEQLFIKSIQESSEIKAELLTTDDELIDKIKSHPALLWATKK